MDSFCIKICVTAEGLSVAAEPLDDMQPAGEPVGSIDEALERVRALYAEQSGGAPMEQQAESDFTAGFA